MALVKAQRRTLIDVRDFGAVCDGATDDTTAWRLAIAHASRSLTPRVFRKGGSAVDYTLRVYVDGAVLGTTDTIAAAASNATVQSALEAVVGSGNVTVSVNAIDSGNDITFPLSMGNVDLLSTYYYGGFPFTGPLIYPRAGSQGVGGEIRGFGLSAISDTLWVSAHGVRIVTGETAPGFFAGGGGGVEALRGGWYSNGLVWIGSDEGGPMVRFRPAGMWQLTGVGFTGTLIAGIYPFTTAADTCLQVTGVRASQFGNIHTVESKADGVLLTTDKVTRGNDYRDWSVSANRFGIISNRNWVNAGNGFRAEGDADDGEVGDFIGQNIYGNKFDGFECWIKDGHGQVWGDSDTNVILDSTSWRHPSGTGRGVLLQAVAEGGNCRLNQWNQVIPGAGGFVTESVSMGASYPTGNEIEAYYPDTGGRNSPATPIDENDVAVESGDRLGYRIRVKAAPGLWTIVAVPFVVSNIPANATTAMSLADLAVSVTGETIVGLPRGGWIVGVSAKGTGISAGGLNFTPTVNGAGVATPIVALNSGNASGGVSFSSEVAIGTTALADGATMGVSIEANGAFQPAGANTYKCLLFVAYPVL